MGLAGQPLSIAPAKCYVKFVGVGKDEIIGVDKFAQQNARIHHFSYGLDGDIVRRVDNATMAKRAEESRMPVASESHRSLPPHSSSCLLAERGQVRAIDNERRHKGCAFASDDHRHLPDCRRCITVERFTQPPRDRRARQTPKCSCYIPWGNGLSRSSAWFTLNDAQIRPAGPCGFATRSVMPQDGSGRTDSRGGLQSFRS